MNKFSAEKVSNLIYNVCYLEGVGFCQAPNAIMKLSYIKGDMWAWGNLCQCWWIFPVLGLHTRDELQMTSPKHWPHRKEQSASCEIVIKMFTGDNSNMNVIKLIPVKEYYLFGHLKRSVPLFGRNSGRYYRPLTCLLGNIFHFSMAHRLRYCHLIVGDDGLYSATMQVSATSSKLLNPMESTDVPGTIPGRTRSSSGRDGTYFGSVISSRRRFLLHYNSNYQYCR
jgi:hypothetical protein